jgi:uncharacterized FlgJ-related protein
MESLCNKENSAFAKNYFFMWQRKGGCTPIYRVTLKVVQIFDPVIEPHKK